MAGTMLAVAALLLGSVSAAASRTPTRARVAEFGQAMLAEFNYDPGYITFNHGSFGAVPKAVMQARFGYLERAEAMPDPWFRQTYREEMRVARARIAEYLNANTDDLVFVESASYAVNSVLRSIGFQPGDKVMYMNVAYPMVKNVFGYLEEEEGVELVQVTLPLPISRSSEIVDAIREALDAHPETRLLSVCHISSTPAIMHPVEDIVTLAHQRGVRVLVDGAHAMGMIPVDLRAIGADYYLSNGHKWFYSAKGSAILYVDPQWQEDVVPAVISSEFAGSTYISRFEYTGTRDYSAMLTLTDALEFRESLGGDDAIMGYMKNLSWWAGNHLANSWGTDLLVPQDMVGALIDVRLPVATLTEAQELQTWLFDTYGAYIVVHQSGGLTQPYTRLSSQIYMDEARFQWLGSLVLDFVRQKARAELRASE